VANCLLHGLSLDVIRTIRSIGSIVIGVLAKIVGVEFLAFFL
jgi:hypothetical protein